MNYKYVGVVSQCYVFTFTGYYLLYSVHLNFASDSVSYLVKYIITLIWKYMPSGVIKDTAY